MRIDIFSIFPSYFDALGLSLIGRAAKDDLIAISAHDLRDWTHDRHRTVDDTPYGGGAGMVMKAEPWGEALDTILARPRPAGQKPVLIIPTPSGHLFTQAMAAGLTTHEEIVFACGRYEGIDHRVYEWASQYFDLREVSLGDYVLNGGEVAALAMIEAIVRLIPGVIGNPDSLIEESHSGATAGWLEYPCYTKPASWRGFEVPEVLLSGHHEKIAQWRHEQSRNLTAQRRPDLLGEISAP